MQLIGIIRVSTEDQKGDKGQLLDRQRESIRRIVAQHGATLLDVVEITDVSGSDVGQSVEWQTRILPRLRDPQTHIAVDAVDRLIRASEFASFVLLAAVQETRTRIYTPSGVQDFSRPDDVLLGGLFALLGGKEKAEIKRRLNAGKEAIRRRGGWVSGKTPCGLSYDKKRGVWSTTPEIECVKRAFAACAAGATQRAVAQILGVNLNNIGKVIENPAYRGILVWDQRVDPDSATSTAAGKQAQNKRLVSRDADAVITARIFAPEDQPVTDEVWHRAQSVLKDRRGQRLGRQSAATGVCWATGALRDSRLPIFPERTEDGLLEIGGDTPVALGRRVYGHQKDNGDWVYRCEPNTIPKFTVPADKMHLALDRYLTEMTSEAGFAKLAERSQPAQGEVVDMATIEADIAKLLKLQRKQNQLFEADAIDLTTLKAKTAQIRKDIAELEAKRDAPQTAPVDVVGLLATVRGIVWPRTGTVSEKRAWLLRHSVTVFIDPNGITGISVQVACGVAGITLADHRPRTFDELCSDFKRPTKRTYLTTTEVSAIVGLTRGQLGDKVRQGRLPAPATRNAHSLEWYSKDIDALKVALAA